MAILLTFLQKQFVQLLSVRCLAETTSDESNFIDTDSYENHWKSFDKFTGHDLAICYQMSQIFFYHSLRYYKFFSEQVIHIY